MSIQIGAVKVNGPVCFGQVSQLVESKKINVTPKRASASVQTVQETAALDVLMLVLMLRKWA